MINTIADKLFCNEVRNQRDRLQKENESLKHQLELKQQHINETNKYWKKKFHDIRRKVKHVRLETSSPL